MAPRESNQHTATLEKEVLDSRIHMNGKPPHPIPYQGSKRKLVPQIFPHFPHSFTRLVEPFAGSAAISLATANQNRCNSFWINDGHEPLIKLWTEILERPHKLADDYRTLWLDQAGREREYFDVVREKFNQSHEPHHFLYLLARCVKAAIRYNRTGGFNNTPDNRRKGASPDTMEKQIDGASTLLRDRTQVSSLDYSEVLAKCTPDDLIYMDPPYRGVCGTRDQRYLPRVDHEQFCGEIAKLNARKCRFIISYDGRTGNKAYGPPLPKSLGLKHLEIICGRSAQATLLGREDVTCESLYTSSTLN